MQVRACALSDVGRTRRFNEDYFGLDNERRIFLVADGMGGHGNGEVASRLVVKSIQEFYDELESQSVFRRSRGSAERSQHLEEAVNLANSRVLEEVEKDGSLVGMGTTLVAMLVDTDRATVAHVGDSRAYRLRDNRLKLLTSDHTWVNEQVNAGNISESQAKTHPFKSVITRALGGDRDVQVELHDLELAPGDVYLLCSDGLTGMISDDSIRRHLAADEPLEEICNRLVAEANAEGGRDNITVLVMAVD